MKTNKVHLLDANVLIALATPDHTLHDRAREWFRQRPCFATCPITQGALLRFYLRWAAGSSIAGAKDILGRIAALPNHQFWPDDVDYLLLPEKGLLGHRQVTDAYLVLLASAHGGVVATLDEGLAAIHSDTLLI